MYEDVMRKFIKDNKFVVSAFLLISAAQLPLESIGFTNYFTKMFDELRKTNGQNYSIVIQCIFVMVCLYLSIRVLGCIVFYLDIIIDNNLMRDVRNVMFQDTLNKYKSRYSEIETGKLVSMFNIVPARYQDLIYKCLRQILPRLLAILVLNVYFYTIDIRLGLFITVCYVIFAMIVKSAINPCQNSAIAQFSNMHQLNEKLLDKMSNIFSILANSQHSEEKNANSHREDYQRDLGLKANRTHWKFDVLLNIYVVCFFLIGMIAYVHIFKQKKDVKIIASFFVFIYLFTYIDGFKWDLIDYFVGVAVIRNYERDLVVSSKTVKHGQLSSGIKNGNIILQDVTIAFKNKTILNKLSANFDNNTITAIIGKSGSGKSTLMKLILGVLPPDEGVISIDGTSIEKFSPNYLHENIATVSQDVKLFNDNIYKNIKYGNSSLKNHTIDKTVDNLNLRSTVFKNLPNGLNSPAGVQGTNLSNGQRQIVLILRAHLQNKKILILDEPTTSLDVGTKEVVLELIKNISKQKTTIIVTHDHDTKNIADKTFELKK